MINGDDKPDLYTNAWWRTQMRGVMHSINRCNAEYEGCWDAVRELREQVAEQNAAMEDARAEIGEMKETIEKARSAFLALRESKGGE